MDISCNICGGKGCNFCKHTGWVEILGCGMVDPHDLDACGIDSNVYTGYAFGMGVERITNLKYRVSDLRLFSENDTANLNLQNNNKPYPLNSLGNPEAILFIPLPHHYQHFSRVKRYTLPKIKLFRRQLAAVFRQLFKQQQQGRLMDKYSEIRLA